MGTIIATDSPYLLNLDYSNLTSAEQVLVDSLIDVAEDYLQNKLWNRQIVAATFSNEKLDGTGEPSIFIKNPPINSLTDIDLVTTVQASDNIVSTYDNTYFDYESKTGEIRWKGGCDIFPCGFQNIWITYNGGFSTIPETVKMLVADFVMYTYDPSLNDGVIEKEKLGHYFYAKALDLIEKFPTAKKKLFASYRLHRVPSR